MSRLAVGMRVRCVDASPRDGGFPLALTLGKEYTVVAYIGDLHMCKLSIDDSGHGSAYYWPDRFVPAIPFLYRRS